MRSWITVAAMLMLTLPASVVSAYAQAKPNILLIIADDMGLDASPCYAVGNNAAPMPNLEKLCEQGVVFENAYAAPTCSPTRATIMTGRYGFRTGVGGAITPGNNVGLSADETSLFDVLSDEGYASALIGKWHLADQGGSLDHPTELGVSDFYGIYSGTIRDYYHWEVVENGEMRAVSGYTTTVFTDRAINWIAEQEAPWFLWLAYNAPHSPFHLPPSELHGYGDLPTDETSIRQNRLPYYNAALQALDTEMGRLLRSLTEETRNNTIVIFIGDNGTPGQVARQYYGERGAKGGIFEGGTHVPLIVTGPEVENGRNTSLVNSTDLFATIASLSGADMQTTDAFDLRSALAGGESARDHVYVEHFTNETPRGRGTLGWAIRDDRYKLVVVEGVQPMLFDLEADPFEKVDLLAEGGSEAAQEITRELLIAHEQLRE
ncbi:MAG: sulfatase-like hydrolase/transferase [Stappiaceae bacterium]